MIDPDDLPALLTDLLPDHLVHQRWAGAHDRPIVSVTFRWTEVVCQEDEVQLVWGVVDALHVGGEPVAFQLFLGLRPDEPRPDFLEGKERELVGTLPGQDGGVVVYDALVDPDLAIAVLHLVAPDQHVEVRRPLVLEHSNSSVVFDERLILKLFRRVDPGPNPDMEISRVLAETGVPHVLAPLAELRRDGTDLAVLRDFLVGATEGWQLARTSMRDLLASALAPEECGGDLAPDMERLGEVIGEVHVAMAAAWGSAPGDTEAWVEQMREQLALVEASATEHLVAIDTAAVRRRFDELAALHNAGRQIRIHGDLHLAQVIRVDDGWRVLDFEGEPARRRDDRFTTSSPLRDVAGILRSLHYAAATGLAEWGADDETLVELADAWETRNRQAFLGGYLAVSDVHPLLPSGEAARDQILAAFELDKAIYELFYELSYRPDQATIPAAGIARLIGSGTS